MSASLEQVEQHWYSWLEKRKKGIIRDEEYPYAEQLLRLRKAAAQEKKVSNDNPTDTAKPQAV